MCPTQQKSLQCWSLSPLASCHKIPQTGRLINKSDLSATVLGPGSLKSSVSLFCREWPLFPDASTTVGTIVP